MRRAEAFHVNHNHFKPIDSCLQINMDGYVCGCTQTPADASVRWLGPARADEPLEEVHVRQMTDFKS